MFIKPTPIARAFYAMNANMHFSFDSLQAIFEEKMKSKLKLGDIIICDNRNKTKRKVLQMTSDGLVIYYGRLSRGMEYTELAPVDMAISKLNLSLF